MSGVFLNPPQGLQDEGGNAKFSRHMNTLLPPRRKRITGINIVPLIDVMTVLIFFFLMSMKFDDLRQLGITPPQSDSASESKGVAPQLVVAVNKNGEFFVNSERVPSEELSDRLKRISGGQDLKKAVIIADEETPMKYVVFALDEARACRLDTRLMTRPGEE